MSRSFRRLLIATCVQAVIFTAITTALLASGHAKAARLAQSGLAVIIAELGLYAIGILILGRKR